ncbi:protein-disulfide reductase DsbD family protein [Falsiroseomonas tokyonensis]|uniref:Protein-disulfide reductase DsbD family protein n=1 Tax=Falsiroseomonas tokyonensis TaxID=430521 RepID=A0ABV7BZ88_9PROT|nr:protein-disulfide reductase DsbD domain-containing protein [Falsiroseomonas tokyonensis]MBU8540865.1 thioredoxin family protein [Falsiroseomonas tokyonensis]
MLRRPSLPLGPLLLGLVLAVPAAAPASAVESAAISSPRATATLVADSAAVAPGQTFQLGLRLRLAPGWHSYWRNAGDAGAAPEVVLNLPEGASAGPIAWPAPERIPYGPLVNYGYTNEVLLPLPVTLPASLAPGELLTLQAEATWLVCADVCIPEEGQFSLTLPVAETATPSPLAAPLFEAADAALPRALPWPVQAGGGAGRASLTLGGTGLTPAALQDAFFFPAEPGVLDNTAPQPMTLRDGRLTLGLTLLPDAAAAALEGTLVLRDGGGQRAAFAISAPLVGPAESAATLPLWQALLLALAGGLILNLMPCVFPVLAMKAMALARLGGAARGEIRWHATAYTAGVLVSFGAIGGLLVALRAAGTAAGWGFQFTEPAFVAAMAWLVLAVGLNLSGVFVLGRTMGAGQSLAGRGGALGAFATGGLAVLLATPCTAPFMAAALGAALVMPPAATMAVFLALGLGLAAPYALLGLAPGLACALPRPGLWMERLRQALAFPMYATAAWLVWVLALQAGPDGVLLGLAGAVVLAAGLWGLGLAQRAGAGGWRIAGVTAAGVAVLAALALLPRLSAAPAVAAQADAQAEPWSAARVEALRAAGRPVFVNATAAWCITCQVNDRVALRAAAVRDAFAAQDVAYLKADWTRGDPAIGAMLREQGREGVPLYLYWAPGAATPQVLPQILTEGLVLEALRGG